MGESTCILVCVTAQKGSAALIRRGREIASARGIPLRVLHVHGGPFALGSPENAEILNELFSLAHEADAEMHVLHDPDVPAAIVRYAADCGALALVLGPDRSGTVGKIRRLLDSGVELIQQADERAEFV